MCILKTNCVFEILLATDWRHITWMVSVNGEFFEKKKYFFLVENEASNAVYL